MIESVLLGILTSVIASLVFWLFTFRISRTKIEFSETIEKSKGTGEYDGDHRYRIKLINSGNRDLTEVVFLVKISIKTNCISNYTYLGLGNENRVPILHGKKYQLTHTGISFSIKLTLYPTQTTMNEFKKSLYSNHIRKKADDGTLSVEDILNEYGQDVKITVYVYGNDALTGARKMFISQIYTIDSIKSGKYVIAKSLPNQWYYRKRYRRYVADTLNFIETQEKNP